MNPRDADPLYVEEEWDPRVPENMDWPVSARLMGLLLAGISGFLMGAAAALLWMRVAA